jgi:hypothetical protein
MLINQLQITILLTYFIPNSLTKVIFLDIWNK